jgi:ABC-type branched-subunit amino acid transport system ATPase component
MTESLAVRVRGLRKRYADTTAVDGIDLDIATGEIFALLGPNGAGKTTTVEILEGHRRRDGGEVSVLGADPQKASTELAVRRVRLHGGRCTSAAHVVTLEALDADGRTVATDTARLTIGEAPC